MRKITCIWNGAIGFCMISFFIQRAYFLQKESDHSILQETAVEDSVSSQGMSLEGNTSSQEMTLETPVFPQEIFDEDGVVRDIFADNGIVDLGNNCIAYQVPNNEVVESIFGHDEYFAGDRYIAICALDFNNSLYTDGDTYYLPDTYGNIVEMKMGEERYEVVLERVSSLYDFFVEHNWNVANYRLVVKSESGDVVSEQILLNHSVKYEEPHWLVDFTKDGYLDMSCLIVTVDGDDTMYSYSDGEWKMVRRLEYDSSEGKKRELFYSEDGNVIEERVLEWDEVVDNTNVWNRDNVENVRLYPEYPLWDIGIMDVGGIDVKKYYRRSEEDNE